jgi:hypothetical protein
MRNQCSAPLRRLRHHSLLHASIYAPRLSRPPPTQPSPLISWPRLPICWGHLCLLRQLLPLPLPLLRFQHHQILCYHHLWRRHRFRSFPLEPLPPRPPYQHPHGHREVPRASPPPPQPLRPPQGQSAPHCCPSPRSNTAATPSSASTKCCSLRAKRARRPCRPPSRRNRRPRLSVTPPTATPAEVRPRCWLSSSSATRPVSPTSTSPLALARGRGMVRRTRLLRAAAGAPRRRHGRGDGR